MSNNGHKKILIIEGEISAASNLAGDLESRGFKVIIAQNSKEAFQKALLDVDIILLDAVLPDAEGFEVCHRLKSTEDTVHIPIILLANHPCSPDEKIEGFRLGADDFINRPIGIEELIVRMDLIFKREFLVQERHKEQHQIEIIKELKSIIEMQAIVPYFQPVYSLKQEKMVGLEILSRPMNNKMFTNPEVLFSTAIKYGFYFDLEMLSWNKALAVIKHNKTNGHALFFNCSPHLIEASQAVDIKGVFAKNNFSVQNVFLEITERSAVVEVRTFYERLNNYRETGFKIAVDDVGGGYGSLESIVMTRPEVVKIDRHIVQSVHDDPVKRSIIKLIVSFCQENNVTSVGEGVETKKDLETLKDIGVDAAQGYYLCRPTDQLNLEEMEKASKLI